MDQQKIGKFIASRRKAQNLTQMQLAEKLSVTDRAVSKWERGKSLPDSAIMLDLCALLKISVNDLLNGEIVTMENYNKEMENRLLEMIKEKELADRRLLRLEIFLGTITSVIFIALVFVAAYIDMKPWVRALLIVIGLIEFFIGMTYALKIEQTAGYYQCEKCGNSYVPTFRAIVFSMHAGRTRYLRCPVCHKKSWQKKKVQKNSKK